ncbi:MAG TPA: NfeD family protein [Candidatus Polarisedimenticolia bacterium]|nr:NfeD family protein [Candidatus Polarisedimenticolia bacterium]
MSVSWNWLLILAGAAMILIEVAAGGFAAFDLVLIGTTFVIGGAVGLMFQGLYLGLFVTGVLCALYIAVGRRWVRSHFDLKGAAVTSNTDSLIGRKGIVLARIAPHLPGRVRVNQEEWRAVLPQEEAEAVEEGAEITVIGLDGVTLTVR